MKPVRSSGGGEYTDTSAALRHAVYNELLCALPPASARQTEIFIANLALQRRAMAQPTTRTREAELSRTFQRFMLLKVTPHIAETGNTVARSAAEIEHYLTAKFGDRLAAVAGFHRPENSNRWRVNLPEAAALHGYRSRHGFYNGILCQPIDSINIFFLLSSSRFDGPKAIRLEHGDQSYFEQGKEPAEYRHNSALATAKQASLDGYKWNGRRFVESANK